MPDALPVTGLGELESKDPVEELAVLLIDSGDGEPKLSFLAASLPTALWNRGLAEGE